MERPEDFPELRFTELQRYAKRWVKKYSGAIQRICLYNYVPERLGTYKEIWLGFPIRYALVFEILPKISNKTLKRLETATEQGETIHRGYPALFDNRFFSVYFDKPEDDYYRHWVVFLKKEGQNESPGTMVDEPYWVLYDAEHINEADGERPKLNARRFVPYTNLSTELFPDLNSLEFTRRAREWVEKWPLISDIRLYAGKGKDNKYVLIVRTADKTGLDAFDWWTDSLIPLQQDLLSIHRNKNSYSIGLWKMFVLDRNEELPSELIHDHNYWHIFETDSQNIQQQHEKDTEDYSHDESGDEKVLWVVYSPMREVLLKDSYGHNRLLAKPNFDSVNDNFLALVYENPEKRFTLKDLAAKGIDLKNKSLHKVVDELGFRGKLKKLFFKVAQDVVVFNNPVTVRDLLETSITISEKDFSRIFFT